ncbi:hypothetical protein [Halobacillus sp. A5]|uniref:hypothetical protein n=1 Tax=Halobacillus sp. A5 TaxID=2880263 RepID=UPI0020A6508D|nr:hypothetical protein [Halobacillus sp. A5]MCP3027718.1 hypothetical protein [Halobacillus sp. A5]
MKKVIFLLALTSFLLIGCSEEETNANKKYANLLSTDEGSYALYIVAEPMDEITNELLQNKGIHNVKSWVQETSLENARLNEVKEMPAFMVFDTKSKVYETNSRQELFEFLQEN